MDGNLNPPPPDLPLLHHLKLSLLRQRLVKFTPGKMAAAAAAGAARPPASTSSSRASVSRSRRAPKGRVCKVNRSGARSPRASGAARARAREEAVNYLNAVDVARGQSVLLAPSLGLHHRHRGPAPERPGPVGRGGSAPPALPRRPPRAPAPRRLRVCPPEQTPLGAPFFLPRSPSSHRP